MIKLTGISKSFGEQLLFNELDLTVNRGERLGLLGRNGCGKTTLFSIILGRSEADAGAITMPKNYRVGHLEQHIRFTEPTVLREACRGLQPEEANDTWKAEKVLFGLGFTGDDLARDPAVLSGGYQLRLNLAKVLVSEPDLLLLDEPNNYLDIVALRWLSRFLRSWKGELLLITHDRAFMDSVVTHSAIIHRQKARKVAGGTDKVYAQIAQEEEVYEQTRLNDEKKRRQTEDFIRRFRAKARLAGMVQSRIKCLEKQEQKEKLEKIEDLEFSFTPVVFPAAQMMASYNLSFGYDGAAAPLIEGFSLAVGRRDRICVIGKNGRGKSTLLKLLAGELKPVRGSLKRHQELKSVHFAQTNTARLNPLRTVFEEIMAGDPECLPQRARDIAGSMMFGGTRALKQVEVLSGGERSRVLLGQLLVTPAHLLLLDEPTNHLDMESCDALIDAVDAFDGSVIMVTHNEMYIHHVANRLIVFDGGRVSVFEGTYREFLDTVGWQDEAASAPAAGGEDKPADRKALKKARAELLQERSRAVKPLEEEVRRIEEAITADESELHRATEELVAASMAADAPRIAALSKKTKELRPAIEARYDELEAATVRCEETAAGFSRRLESLGGETL